MDRSLYYQKAREARLAYQRSYYERHRAERQAYQREYEARKRQRIRNPNDQAVPVRDHIGGLEV